MKSESDFFFKAFAAAMFAILMYAVIQVKQRSKLTTAATPQVQAAVLPKPVAAGANTGGDQADSSLITVMPRVIMSTMPTTPVFTTQGYLVVQPPEGATVGELIEYLKMFAPNANVRVADSNNIVVNDGIKAVVFRIPVNSHAEGGAE